MGFSLAGFGAGLAEGMYERIEEERKFSSAALQGRIERASVLKLQQEKQAKEMEDELRSRKAELIQLGVDDPELQKAYLFSPTVFEAFKKAKSDPEMSLKIDPKTFISANTQLLSTMTGTVDDAINNAVRAKQQVEPAKLLEPQGRSSFFAPSASSQTKRFEQLASARGLTLQDVARAESGVGPKMPEPVGAINFDAFPKKEKKELTPEQTQARLEARAISAEMEFGKTDPRAVDARTAFNNYTTIRKNLTPPQADYAQTMAKYKHIVRAPQNYTEEQVKEARAYLDNDDKERKQYADRNEPYPLDPTKESAYRNIFRRSANSAVLRTFGRKKDWKIIDQKDENGRTVGQTSQYDGQLPQELVEQHLLFTEQQAILEAAKQSGYIKQDNTVVNPLVRGALSEFFFKFDGNKVLSPTKPERSLDVEVKPEPKTLPPRTGAASAAPAPAASAPPRTPGPGRAGQGAPAAAPAAARKPAEPKTTAEFEALPPGTPYINPKDKQVYIKN